MSDETKEAVVPKEKADFSIFGSVDLSDKGKVMSTYPSYYFDHMKDALREEITVTENQLSMDLVPHTEVGVTRERLSQKKAKLKEIENSIPQLRGKDKDRIAKAYDELGTEIKERLPSRSDMMKRLADPHREVKMMTEPQIKLRGDQLQLARACNVKVHKDGMVTRTGAEKVWKIAGKILGEATNTEHLRRD
jgi:hypothetical protein